MAADEKEAAVGTPKMLQTRSEPRKLHESAVRVFGLDSAGKPINQTGWTVDISHRGARLRGLPCWSGPGETIGVRQGTEKARYKVVWVGQPGTPQEGQIGVICLEAGKCIWTVPNMSAQTMEVVAALPSATPRAPIGTAPIPTARNNRRKEARYLTSGGAKIQECGSPAGQWTMLHDISLGGCYVETTTPLPPGTQVNTMLHVGELQISARGEITVAHRMVGMGVRFVDMTPINRQRLELVLDQLVRNGAA